MLKRLSIKKIGIAVAITLAAFIAYQVQALVSVPLALTEIIPIQSSAISDNSYEHGWKWTFKVTVPSDETVFKMRFANWTSGEDSIPAANNIRFYTNQSITAGDADHAVQITAANIYSSELLLNETADLNPEMAGRQIEVIVEVKIPAGTQNGSYTTSYAISSTAPVPPIVPDTTAPQITLNGSTTVIVGQNETYTDAGATANDNIDGNISTNIIVTGLPINTTTVSTSTITYTVSDAAGNSVNVIRMVIVRDITPPVIVAGDDIYATSTGEWTYLDIELPTISDASGYTIMQKSYASTSYPVGTTTITWNAEDYYGNASSDIQLVIILQAATITPPVIVIPDTQAPIITPVEFDTIIYGDESSHTVTAEGGIVNFNLQATDNVDANVAVICTPTSNTLIALGTHNVTCTATDTAGNVGTYAFELIIRDSKGPVITINGDTTLQITVGTEYVEAGATANDAVDGPVSVEISGSVNTNTVGEYTINYSARDTHGWMASSNRVVNVVPAVPAPAAEAEAI